jgi:hypothetical protein
MAESEVIFAPGLCSADCLSYRVRMLLPFRVAGIAADGTLQAIFLYHYSHYSAVLSDAELDG